MNNSGQLKDFGWQAFFQQQLSLEDWETTLPARVIEQHRSEIVVVTEEEERKLPILNSMPALVVGDWILLDEQKHFSRLLERKTCFARKSAGSTVKEQLLSANVDTAFIVCSMNNDFNLNRIERYLSLVHEAGAFPVVVLTKADLAKEPHEFIQQVQALDAMLMVEAVNALEEKDIQKLSTWVNTGETIVLLGSSGVGKSTLINTLQQNTIQATGSIREDDSKGRHTTTTRSLIRLMNGGLIIDTPGMREIQLADTKEGIARTFADIESLAQHCKFSDCTHTQEPGCAVIRAVETNELDERRLNNYLKLLKEEKHNSATLSEKRANEKALGKFYKKTQGEAAKIKGRTIPQ